MATSIEDALEDIARSFYCMVYTGGRVQEKYNEEHVKALNRIAAAMEVRNTQTAQLLGSKISHLEGFLGQLQD